MREKVSTGKGNSASLPRVIARKISSASIVIVSYPFIDHFFSIFYETLCFYYAGHNIDRCYTYNYIHRRPIDNDVVSLSNAKKRSLLVA